MEEDDKRESPESIERYLAKYPNDDNTGVVVPRQVSSDGQFLGAHRASTSCPFLGLSSVEADRTC